MEATESNRWSSKLLPTVLCSIHFFLLYFIHHQVLEVVFSLSDLVEKLKQEAQNCIDRPSRFKLLGLNCPILVEDTWAYCLTSLSSDGVSKVEMNTVATLL